jgi:hypothetical protein
MKPLLAVRFSVLVFALATASSCTALVGVGDYKVGVTSSDDSASCIAGFICTSGYCFQAPAAGAVAADAMTDGDAVASVRLPGMVADGQPCEEDSDCESQNCVSTDDVTFVCASPCSDE